MMTALPLPGRSFRPAGARAVLAVAAASLLVSCGSSATGGEPPYRTVATVDEIMDAIVIPAADAIFDAVVYDNAELVAAPGSDEDWYALKLRALAIAEAGNLLLMPPRARPEDDWMHYARAMTDGAVRVAGAAAAHDIERLLDTGSEMYTACTGCHDRYLP